MAVNTTAPEVRQVPSFAEIRDTVCGFTEISVNDFGTKRKDRLRAYTRQVAWLLAREMTNLSLPQLGRMSGGRHHTSILYGVRQARRAVMTDPRDLRTNLYWEARATLLTRRKHHNEQASEASL